MICIKSGMQNEYDVAKEFSAAGTLILTGVQTVDDLQKQVPLECSAIMSFGMAGGIRPKLPIVGQTVIADRLIGPQGEQYHCDSAWNHRLFLRTKFYTQPYFSSGTYNTANTPAQRAAIFAETGAWCIDDESLWVAQFAKQRGIPFTIMRNVSDAWNDNVSITSNLLAKGGSVNVFNAIADFVSDPIEMAEIAAHYEVSQSQLEASARKVGPDFCWGA